MSELSSIKSQALTERIEERLFAYILDNHLKVGAKLRPRQFRFFPVL